MKCDYPICGSHPSTGNCRPECGKGDFLGRILGYRQISRTSSGWIISTSDNALPDFRWCATHALYGETKFFKTREEILEFTCRDMVERAKPLIDQLKERGIIP